MKFTPHNFRSTTVAALALRVGATMFVCSALACAVARSSTPADATQPISIAEYKAELHRVERGIEEQRDHFKAPAGSAEHLNVEIPAMWHVESRGQHFEVPTSELKINLEDNPDRVTRRILALNADLARVQALEAEADKLESESSASSYDAARAKLQEILGHREFSSAQEKKSWIREMWEKLVGWVEDIFDRLFNAVGANRPVRNLILYGVIVIGFIALGWILVRVLGGVARRENLKLEPPAFPVKSSGQWTREAMAAAARGDYREAIHCGYWAGVYRLAETGIWELDESRTPREYLRLLSARPRSDAGADMPAAGSASSPVTILALPDPAVLAVRTQALSALTRSFESVWYADEPATQEKYSAAVAHLEELECRLPSTAPTAGS